MPDMQISTLNIKSYFSILLLTLFTLDLVAIGLPDIDPYHPTKWRWTLKREPITPIVDDPRCQLSTFDTEQYQVWCQNKVNPYDISLVDMEEVITIDLDGYYPPTKKYVTSNFGWIRWRYHYGIDLKVHRGDQVYSAFDGVVRIATRVRGYGNFVVVRHCNGLETLYAHLNRIDVAVGDSVKAGSSLGMGGNTGRSTGYHLHFEIRYLGNAINPNDLIDFDKCEVKNRFFQLGANTFEYQKEIAKIRYWVVRSGDTLSRISARTGISIARLCSLNGINRNSILRIGQRIRYT